jgi:hypothetical protein
MGYGGDWDAHLDSDRWSLSDEWDTVGTPDGALVMGTGISFQVGGVLLQKPLTGGVYISSSGERIDCTHLGEETPSFSFAPSATNYVFVRPPTTRTAYADRLIQTSAIPPANQGWMYVRTVTTDVATITNDVNAGYGTGFSRRGYHGFHNYDDGAAFSITGSSTFAPNVLVQATGGASLMYLVSDTDQTGLQVQAIGTGNTAIYGTIYAGASMLRANLTTTESVGMVCDTFGATPGIPLAMFPAATAPGTGTWTGYTRLFTINQLQSGYLRWYDKDGNTWYPHAAQAMLVKQGTISGASPIIASGGATTLVTLNVSGTFKQNHWYLIRAACEATNNALANFTQAVTVAVNAVAVAPYNGYNLIADRDGLQKPWLSATMLYQHTPADAVNPAITLSIVHGAGASSCQYFNARIYVLGPWYF